ncbi:MAG: PEBP family protein [Roseibium sp.]
MRKAFSAGTKTPISVGVCLTVFSSVALAQKKPPPPKGGKGPAVHESSINSSGANSLIGEVWVDNWFKLYVDGIPLLEDSVSLATERSFNAERFEFNADYPMILAFEFRDFMENETGLEYIGSRKQQMGDGGAIAQFKDKSTGKLLAATGSDWRCVVQQVAPVDKSCARERNPTVNKGACAQTQVSVPENWTTPGFDDSSWPKATIHSARDVRPKDGYDRIDWDKSAKLIWGADLERDNVILCRVKVTG